MATAVSYTSAAATMIPDSHSLGRACGIGLMLGATWLALWPSSSSLLDMWLAGQEQSYGHGLLVVLMSLWMVYWRRDILIRQEVRGTVWLLPVIGLTGLLWLIAVRGGLQIVHQVLLPPFGLLVVAALWGPALARHVLLPVGMLYFAIPVWSALTTPLQQTTVIANQVLLGFVDVPHFISGRFIKIPEGIIEIADTCAGVNFFIVGLCLAVFLGELNRDTWSRRILLVAIAALFSMASNSIRVAIIIYAGHVTNMQHPLITEGHYDFGWVVFAVTMALFFLTSRYLPVAADPAVHPAHTPQASSTGAQWPGFGMLTATLVCVAVAPAWAAVLNQRSALAVEPINLPSAPPGWNGPAPGYSAWHPVLQGADARTSGWYRHNMDVVEVLIADYAEQRQGKEINGFGNSITGADLTGPLEQQRIDLGPARVNAWVVRDAEGLRWQLWYGYRVGGYRFHDEIAQALWYGLRSLIGPVPSRIEAARSPCRPDCDAANERLGLFWREALLTP